MLSDVVLAALPASAGVRPSAGVADAAMVASVVTS